MADEVALLREALRPFADFADERRRMRPDMMITTGSPMARRQLTMGDCYAAADALAATDPDPVACARCGHPLEEHHYNGACYGLCQEFVPKDKAREG